MKNRTDKLKSLFSVLLLCAVMVAGPAFAQQEISGSQSGTLGPGEYLVTGNISVSSGNTLTIKPGTKFFHNGNHAWEISGALRAEGTPQDSIYFIRKDAVAGHRWDGIQIKGNSTDSSILDYCIIDNCHTPTNYYGAGLRLDKGCIVVKNSSITNCEGEAGGGICCSGESIVIENCFIAYNKTYGT